MSAKKRLQTTIRKYLETLEQTNINNSMLMEQVRYDVQRIIDGFVAKRLIRKDEFDIKIAFDKESRNLNLDIQTKSRNYFELDYSNITGEML